jgi:hypothetical protein
MVEGSLPQRILFDDEDQVIKSVSFHDLKWLPEKTTKNQLQFNVVISVVFFDITTPKGGRSK